MYDDGDGVAQDSATAYMWFSVAVMNGLELVQSNLVQLKQRLTTDEIREAEARARVCLETSYADCGLVGAISADVQASDGTSLIEAVNSNDSAEIKRLLEAGAHVDHPGEFGATALMRAAEMGHGAIAEMLLASGASADMQNSVDGATALFIAAQEGHREIAQSLLEHGADPNAKLHDGGTALMVAADRGHRAIVNRMLAQGAALNVQSNNGATALMFAANKGFANIVSTLLELGANTELKFQDGRTALDFAKSADIQKMLRDAQTCNLGAAQSALKKLGHYSGVVDGIWGPNTRNAVSGFQTDQELDTTGVLGSPTCSRLIH